MENNKPEIGLLRFTTAGSVDDGKSTLIGRLLYDSKSIFEDQLDNITETSKRKGNEEVDLSLLTDGLRAEREQGITIDVAYRYFSTTNRKFIIADTPGHIQYTRNMVTGASTADVAVILVDARNGVIEQSIRHTYIAALLNMKHIIFCINKMDLVDFSEERFNEIKKDVEELSAKLKAENIHIIPISAKFGDNVVEKSENLPWFKGETFLHLLETVRIADDYDSKFARFPVQYVIRPQSDEYHDFRGYAGRLTGGRMVVGDSVTIFPSMLTSRIKSIEDFGQDLYQIKSGESVTLTLEDDIDISRGNMIALTDNQPKPAKEFKATVCWFNERPLQIRGKYILRHSTNEVRSILSSVDTKININTLEKDTIDKEVKMNDIANVSIKTSSPIFIDNYRNNPVSGSFILIDEATNETMGAGMIYD
ncbi:MAG: sulfate adenylyltransferase [Marinilabiliales bacterium]|nr:MAG: sulfate adenylyltransferase [Marinilabiliales bacterium]